MFGGWKRWLFAVPIPVAAWVAFSCQSPTQMTLVLRTDMSCGDIKGVSIVVGSDMHEATERLVTGTSDARSVPVTSDCKQGPGGINELGTIVLTPGRDTGAVIVRAGAYGVDPLSCTPKNGYKGCIVARRIFTYLDHTPQTLPVRLTKSCVDVPCGIDSTCDDKKCRDANTVCANGVCDVGGNRVVPTATATTTATPTATTTATSDASKPPPVSLRSIGKSRELGTCARKGNLVNTNPECHVVRIESGCGALVNSDAFLVVSTPPGPLKGTILFGRGEIAAESSDYYDTLAYASSHMTTLFNEGYRIVQYAWDQPASRWMRGSAGPGEAACLYATMATFVRDRYHAASDGKFCGVAHSSATLELGYALTWYGRESIFDYALFSSGPSLVCKTIALAPAPHGRSSARRSKKRQARASRGRPARSTRTA